MDYNRRHTCRSYDLSIPTEESPSEPLPVVVEHQSHKASAALMAGFFAATVDDLPAGNGWANDQVSMNAHSGTHVDAPWHYYPTCATGPRGPSTRCPWSGSTETAWCSIFATRNAVA